MTKIIDERIKDWAIVVYPVTWMRFKFRCKILYLTNGIAIQRLL